VKSTSFALACFRHIEISVITALEIDIIIPVNSIREEFVLVKGIESSYLFIPPSEPPICTRVNDFLSITQSFIETRDHVVMPVILEAMAALLRGNEIHVTNFKCSILSLKR